MPKINRNSFETNIFHIMSQGINQEYIFDKEQDKRKYRKLLFLHNRNFEVEIIAYCIMGNHVHLLIESNKIENMSNFMHQINMEYAIYYNKNRNRVGYVFRSRYKSEPINTEKYLINCIHYIHNNPIKAHICKEKSKYLYSSYNPKIKENEKINKKWKENYYYKEDNDEITSFICTKEEKEQEIEETIKDYKGNEKELAKIIKILLDKKVSMRKIEKIFNIDKKKIKRLVEKYTC